MKHLFLLVLIILITSTVSIGQMQKAISTKSKSVKFRTTRIEKWGVKSLDLPSEFVASEEMSEPHKNKDITWIQYSRSWGKPLKNKLSSFDADFSVTTWNTDFAKVLGLSSEFATPENILAVENSGSERRKNSGEEPVEETGTLEVSGLKGNFFRAQFGENKNQIMVGWYTYRYFESNAQRISISVICLRSKLQKALKIIQSIKFQ